MRVITLTWERTTGALSVDNFNNITRGDICGVELFITSSGSKFLLPEEVVIEAVAKQSAAMPALVKISSFARPSDPLKPYTATLNLKTEALIEAFVDEVEGEVAHLDLHFELQSSDGPTSSARVDLRVYNEYVREDDPLGELPIEESPSDWLSARAVRHDVEQELTPAQQNQACSNLGLTGGKIDVQIFDASGTYTWTKPEGAKMVQVRVIGGGHGGGSGDFFTPGTASSGGHGGGTGLVTEALIDASLLDADVAVIVGAGGAGGTYNFITNSPEIGAAGEASHFGPIVAFGGSGAPSTNGLLSYIPYAYRTTAGNSIGAGGSPTPANQLIYRMLTGGGAGGGVSVNPAQVFRAGYAGGSIGVGSNVPVLGSEGGLGGNDAMLTPELMNGVDGKIDPISGHATGGGGGGSVPGGNVIGGGPGAYCDRAGNGGNGLRGSGGGGGGCIMKDPFELRQHYPGDGGKGGDGYIIVTTFC